MLSSPGRSVTAKGVPADPPLVSEDASLDDFLAESADSDDAADGDGVEAEDADEAPESAGPDGVPDSDPDPEAVEPAASTYDWAPDGAPCDACGALVEARWRDGGALVCAECKEW